VILDAGFLVSVDRDEHAAKVFLAAAARQATPLRTSQAVVGQVWRNGSRQARLARFLHAVEIHSVDDGRSIGVLLASSRTADVVDAHLVLLGAAYNEPILTGDVDDLNTLVASLERYRPTIYSWPPNSE
jgi:hypothetical protein